MLIITHPFMDIDNVRQRFLCLLSWIMVSAIIHICNLNALKTGLGRKRKSESPAQSQPMSKRKRVSFGVNLSPELFDKRLPPGTPVRKGSAPRRVSVGESMLECMRWWFGFSLYSTVVIEVIKADETMVYISLGSVKADSVFIVL